MDETELLFERDGGVATLTLNRPSARNAINVSLARALMEASITCDEDDSIRCVVLTGAGRMFCPGGDVFDFAQAGSKMPMLIKELTAYLHMAIARFARMNKPLVTAVNGAAAGAGLGLAVLGDIALAARSAHFSLAYRTIGLSPDGGATWLLPRLMGLRRAQEFAFTDKRVSADEAATLGLVTRVVADDELVEQTNVLARALAASATRATGRTRELLLSSFNSSLETQMELEARAIAEGGRDTEGQERVAALLAKLNNR